MRETIEEWKKEWFDTNGETEELEVVIQDSTLGELAPYVYEGNFRKIPVELDEKKVISYGKICTSTVPERIGAYSLTI